MAHKQTLVFSSEGSFIYRLLCVQMHFYQIRTFICLFIRVSFSPVISLDCASPCACPYPLWDRGLPLSPNSGMHVWPQISTERPPPFIVGLIRYDPTQGSSRSKIMEQKETWKVIARSYYYYLGANHKEIQNRSFHFVHSYQRVIRGGIH